ncbi:copper-binding protein [Singulisphaera rosea]
MNPSCPARLLTLLLTLFGWGMLAGCAPDVPSQPAPGVKSKAKTEARTTSTKTYTLVGVVRKINANAKEVLIAHEAIPGFMGAMTMPFSVKDPAIFEDLRQGDEVEGPLRVISEGGMVKDYELVDLVVTKPALAEPKVLEGSGRTLAMATAPKRLEPGQEVPDFTMTTQDGRSLRLEELRGHVVVLTFIYTRCPLPDFCPAMDRKFTELASKVSASPKRAAQVRLLSVSFDPEHDTPEVLRKHAAIQGARPPLWTFAVASHDELAKVASPLGLMYGPAKDEIIHNLCTAIIDPSGKLVQLAVGSTNKNWSASDMFKVIAPLATPSTGP